MKVFTVSFGGHYLGGTMVIVAETQEIAYDKAKEQIAKMGLTEGNEYFPMHQVVELDTTKESVVVLDDGNY